MYPKNIFFENFGFSVLASLEPRISFVIYICCYLTELPWNQATLDISDYSKWKENDIETSGHWQRIQDNLLLSLIKKMLNHGPSKRYNLNQIKNHLWFKKKFKDSGILELNFSSGFSFFIWFWMVLLFILHPLFFCLMRRKKSFKSFSISGTIVTLVNYLNSGSNWYLVWRDLKSTSRKNQWIKWIFRLVLFRCV